MEDSGRRAPVLPVEALRGDGAPGWERRAGAQLRRGDKTSFQGAHPAILSGSEALATPVGWVPHAHPRHLLVWVRSGTMSVRLADRILTIPEGRGLWLPAGTVHSGMIGEHVVFHHAYFAPDEFTGPHRAPIMLTVPPVLEALLIYLESAQLLPAARWRAEAVVFDVMQEAEHALSLRLPEDPRVRPLVDHLLAHPGDRRSLAQWAQTLGVGERTLTRIFTEGAGIGFGHWHRELRIHYAVGLLGQGWDVRDCAAEVGYLQTSTFIAAFRAVMGTTPGSFRRVGGKTASDGTND